jgi:hypothetical protein
MVRRDLMIFAALLALAPSSLAQSQTPTAAASVARLLEAMGGRAAWSDVRFVRVTAIHSPPLRAAGDYLNRISNDLTAGRVLFEARNGGFERSRAMLPKGGWRSDEGAVRALTDAEWNEDRAWWSSNIYRTLHRLAANDPALTARLAEDGALEIVEAGALLNAFRLGADGAPYMFRAGNGAWTAFGPLASTGKLRYPKWGVSATGTFRYEIAMFEALSAPPLGFDAALRAPGP